VVASFFARRLGRFSGREDVWMGFGVLGGKTTADQFINIPTWLVVEPYPSEK
jgi:hypothetical protein